MTILKAKTFLFFERVLFSPKKIEWIFPILLFPLSIIYCIFSFLNSYRKFIFRKNYNIKIIGVGNLVLGGTGKTPFTIAIAKKEKKVAIVLRGYGRDSKGTLLVSKWGEVLVDTFLSGDEAMLYSIKLPTSSVIVSEDRIKAIELAKKIGAETVILDDSYRQHHIVKEREYLIMSNNSNQFCLPAGAYREKLWFFKDVISVVEDIDFWREVEIINPTQNMVLVTAISKPDRLNRYISKDIPKYHFPDHYQFDIDEIFNIIQKHSATSILTTEKDYVKLKEFNFPLSLIKLELKLREGI